MCMCRGGGRGSGGRGDGGGRVCVYKHRIISTDKVFALYKYFLLLLLRKVSVWCGQWDAYTPLVSIYFAQP